MAKVTTTDVVGTASKTTWSQVQTIAYSKNHQVITVVQLTCEDNDSLVDLPTMGVEIIKDIEQKGREVENIDQLANLTKTIIGGIAQGLKLEILVALIVDSKLSIYQEGGVETYLARGGKLAKLESGQEGELSVGDAVVFSTTQFVEVVGVAKFKQILTQEEKPAELLVPLVHIQAETSGVAAVVAEVGEEEGGNPPMPTITLARESPRRTNLWIGGAIFLLLVIMIGVGMVRRVKQAAEHDFIGLNSSIEAKITETLSIGDLNPERARILLSEAKNEVSAYLVSDIRGEYRQKGEKLAETIENAEKQAFKRNDIGLNTIVELSILVDNLKSEKMKSNGKDNLIFLDTQSAKVVAMNITDRSREVIDKVGSEPYVDLGVFDTRLFGLHKNGVSELFGKKDESKRVIESDEFWENPVLIEMFAGNAYILDKEQGEIWKYPTLGETFGGRRRWFGVGITPDLSNIVDMKVVGDIWLLTSTGKLERYRQGAPATFAMEGFPAKEEGKKLSEPHALWVSESAVYILENGASRVVVFGLDGKYQSQYINNEFAKASDLVVVDGKVYVLIENVVKEFGL